MNNDFGTSTNIHIYKPKRWIFALNIFSFGFMLIVLGIPFILLIMMLVSFIRAETELDTFMTILTCLFIPIVVLLGFNLFQMTIGVIASFFSYIKISPEGIEQKNTPYKHIRSDWSDVDKIGKLFLFTDVIYLNSFEVLGLSLSLKTPLRFLRSKQAFISLTGYEGWPDGQLVDDLKQYAPKLFENGTIPQETSQQKPEMKTIENNHESGLSQETRLLAALSHISVFFSHIGVIVPIAIYATQRIKSSYVGFQALQALIWQIVAFLFSIVASSCMVGSIFIPIFIAASSQNEKVLNFLSGGMFFIILGSVFLIIFGSFAFIIYGVIGAIKTYQGKDFRYILIGNRIDKSKGSKPVKSA